MQRTIRAVAILASLALVVPPAAAQGTKADYARARTLAQKLRNKVHQERLVPHWIANERLLWYRREQKSGTSLVLVDTATGQRRPAFDHARLSAALAKAARRNVRATDLPLQNVEIDDGITKLAFDAFGSRWSCKLDGYELERTGKARPRRNDGRNRRRRRGGGFRGRRPRRPRVARSPDGKLSVSVRDHNLWLAHTGSNGSEPTQLTSDGTEALAWAAPTFAPNGRLLAYRRTPGNVQDVYLIESSPKDQLRAKLRTRPYARPGDELPGYEMWVFDVDHGDKQKIDAGIIDQRPPRLRFRKDGRTFLFEKRERGHQHSRVFEVDTETGAVRTIIDERAKTFIDDYHKHYLHYVGDAEQILWASERDGWNHIYRYDAVKGSLLNQVTRGEFVVRGVDRVDEEAGRIWFHASGRRTGEDPYLIHYYRVNFDGTGLIALTEGNGNHTLQYSPSRRYYVDTWSRVDLPPRHVLREAEFARKICDLETADVSELLATGWTYPEVFTAKGRDDKTDIWGVVVRPTNFDPRKKYPVLENIYAGPHDSFVPKTFRFWRGMNAMAELGFVVVQIDGMGTNNRSRAFHDVCWKNIADAGFPDRIRWIRALGARYRNLDLDRVGIYGTSAGGQSALGALLFHPKFYKAAVAACGCHDNRLDKASWNEQWMGYPVGPHYAAQSNITNAHKLEGKLMLILGELDTNVPPESTLRVVDALVKADKDFDFVFLPGAGHTSGGAYGNRRRMDFFVRNLLGVEPRSR